MYGLYIIEKLYASDYSSRADGHDLCMVLGYPGEHYISYELYSGLYAFAGLENEYRSEN